MTSIFSTIGHLFGLLWKGLDGLRKVLHLIVLLALLAVVGILLDMAEIMVDRDGVARLLVILEDGGEMVVMSVITWFVMHLSFDDDRLPVNWLGLTSGGTGAES